MDATDSHTYRITSAYAYLQLFGPFLILLAAPIAAWQAITTPSAAWFLVIWSGVALWGAYRTAFRTAYRINLSGDSITFKTLATTTAVNLDQIQSIKSRQARYVTVSWDGGKVWVVGPMNDWYDFVTRVKTANPAVQLSGV
jgi:hypothetical protein